MEKIVMTVKATISARDKGIRVLQKEYTNYKKALIPQIQEAVRKVVKDRTIEVYSQQKWMLDEKLFIYVKNLPLHPMRFQNQSVWIEKTEITNFTIHFRIKQEEPEANCRLVVPQKYRSLLEEATGRHNPIIGQVDLIEDNEYGYFNVHIMLRLPKPETYEPNGWIGIDVGWNCLAVSAFTDNFTISDITFHGKTFKTRIIQLKYLLKEGADSYSGV